MRQQKLTRIDADDRQINRTRQFDDMELLFAASELESPCAGWLVDQRATEKFATREPAL